MLKISGVTDRSNAAAALRSKSKKRGGSNFEQSRSVSAIKYCSEGVESGKIEDTLLLNGPSQAFHFSPSVGRLNNDKAWYTRGNGQCLEIDLLELRHVLGIDTEGYQGILNHYVGTCEIKNSYDGITWVGYQDENNKKKDCSEALGVESGKISDTLGNGSSQVFDFSPSKGRLNSDKAWYTRGSGQCFEIDLQEVRHVLAIATQGYQGILDSYVGTFEIKNSYDGIIWLDYQDENKEKKQSFGGSNADTGTYDYFRWAFETRFLIYPKEYNRPWCKCLRVEVNGCSDCAVCSCFSEWPFFLKPITLTNGGHVETGSDNGCQGCHHVPGNAIYYNCLLENKWARVYLQIFKEERSEGKLVFKVLCLGFCKCVYNRTLAQPLES